MEKSALRAKMLHELKTFPDKERESRAICDSLQSLSIYREAETILAFSPLSTEPDISPLFSDERILFPFITGNGEMEYGRGKLVKNKLGFLEPKDKIAIEYHRAIILVPLLALDKHLYRLGRGKGFYDNYLKKNGKSFFP